MKSPTSAFVGVLMVWVFLCFAITSAMGAPSLLNFNWEEARGELVFSVEFGEKVTPKSYDVLREKGYFYADFYGAQSPTDGAAWTFSDHGLKHVKRLFYPAAGSNMSVMRFVFYAPKPGSGTRIRFEGLGRKFSIAVSEVESAAPSPVRTMAKPGAKRLVIIDPGHGGKSLGAKTSRKIGGRDYYEKDLVLQIAQKTAKLFERCANLDVMLTRTGDEYVSLDERIRAADTAKGDFFLSIHLNATPMKVKTPRGFEVYYLDDSSKAADRELENLENDFGIDLDGKIPGQGTVREVLGSLAEEKVRQRKQESILAALVMDQVIKRDGPFKREARGIKAANFRVLMNYNMPSILAECGFIDNPDDAALLVQEKTQDQIAALLFNAINLYFARVEPGYKATLASIP